jgi:hypothetical protein
LNISVPDQAQEPQQKAEKPQKCRSVFYSFLLRCISDIVKDEDDQDSLSSKDKGLSLNISTNSRKDGGLTNERLLRFLHMT